MNDVRLILINGNPLVALFMASWFVQNKADFDQWRNVGVNVLSKSGILPIRRKDSCLLDYPYQALGGMVILSDLIHEIIDCSYEEEPCSFSVDFSLKAFFFERRRRSLYFEKIQKELMRLNICSQMVKEIWVQNSNSRMFFKTLFPSATIIFFEHGTSDMVFASHFNNSLPSIDNKQLSRPAIETHQPYVLSKLNLSFIKKYLHYKRLSLGFFLERKFLFFRNELNPNLFISIFADEIKKINLNLPIKPIKIEFTVDRINCVASYDMNLALYKKELADEPSAMILIHDPTDYLKLSEYDREVFRKGYFLAFESFLLTEWLDELLDLGVKRIFFKGRAIDQIGIAKTADVINQMTKLRQRFTLHNINDRPRFSAEYYAVLLKPKMLFGAYSSALFYVKKILPDTQTCTYDNFSNLYVQAYFKDLSLKEQVLDSIWVRNFYEKIGKEAFLKYIPTDKPAAKN